MPESQPPQGAFGQNRRQSGDSPPNRNVCGFDESGVFTRSMFGTRMRIGPRAMVLTSDPR